MLNCVSGVVDGKYIRILYFWNSGFEFYNCKGFYSIVLMVVVDVDYKFIFVDVECYGWISDGGVFKNIIFWKFFV